MIENLLSTAAQKEIKEQVSKLGQPGGLAQVFDGSTGTFVMLVIRKEKRKSPVPISWLIQGPMTRVQAEEMMVSNTMFNAHPACQ